MALKLNRIAMKKIIHVDHDKVATHVHRWNHDPSHNKELHDDAIEHIYDYDTFEQVCANLDEFLENHGRTYYYFCFGYPSWL